MRLLTTFFLITFTFSASAQTLEDVTSTGTQTFVDSGGDPRGSYAVDFQAQRAKSSQAATGNFAVNLGGRNNQSAGSFSTLVGGENNRSIGFYSTVFGGLFNYALGDFTFAGGRSCVATAEGAWMFGDATNTTKTNSTANSLAFDFEGGYDFRGGPTSLSGPLSLDTLDAEQYLLHQDIWVRHSSDDKYIDYYDRGHWAHRFRDNLLVLGNIGTTTGTVSGAKLGVGITTPTADLHVQNGSNAFALIESTGTDSLARLQLKNDAYTWQIYLDGSISDTFRIRDSILLRNVFNIIPGAAADSIVIDSSGVSMSDDLAVAGDLATTGSATAADFNGLTKTESDTLTDSSDADALHKHSGLSASDGSPVALSADAAGDLTTFNDLAVAGDIATTGSVTGATVNNITPTEGSTLTDGGTTLADALHGHDRILNSNGDGTAISAAANGALTAQFTLNTAGETSSDVGFYTDGYFIGLNGTFGSTASTGTHALDVVASVEDGYAAEIRNSYGGEESHALKIRSGLPSGSIGGAGGPEGEYIDFYDPSNSMLFAIHYNTVQNGHFDNASDAKLKDNITTSTIDSLSRLDGIRIADFNWKHSPGERVEGAYVAQDIEKELPGLVHPKRLHYQGGEELIGKDGYTTKSVVVSNDDGTTETQVQHWIDTTTKFICTSGFIPHLHKSIKQLNKQLRAERAKGRLRDERLDALEARIEALESQ